MVLLFGLKKFKTLCLNALLLNYRTWYGILCIVCFIKSYLTNHSQCSDYISLLLMELHERVYNIESLLFLLA